MLNCILRSDAHFRVDVVEEGVARAGWRQVRDRCWLLLVDRLVSFACRLVSSDGCCLEEEVRLVRLVRSSWQIASGIGLVLLEVEALLERQVLVVECVDETHVFALLLVAQLELFAEQLQRVRLHLELLAQRLNRLGKQRHVKLIQIDTNHRSMTQHNTTLYN